MKTIKLNYRHNLETMKQQLKNHNETIRVYGQAGKIVHEILEPNDTDGKLTKTCGVFYSAKDCAEYINSRNGF